MPAVEPRMIRVPVAFCPGKWVYIQCWSLLFESEERTVGSSELAIVALRDRAIVKHYGLPVFYRPASSVENAKATIDRFLLGQCGGEEVTEEEWKHRPGDRPEFSMKSGDKFSYQAWSEECKRVFTAPPQTLIVPRVEPRRLQDYVPWIMVGSGGKDTNPNRPLTQREVLRAIPFFREQAAKAAREYHETGMTVFRWGKFEELEPDYRGARIEVQELLLSDLKRPQARVALAGWVSVLLGHSETDPLSFYQDDTQIGRIWVADAAHEHFTITSEPADLGWRNFCIPGVHHNPETEKGKLWVMIELLAHLSNLTQKSGDPNE